MSTIRKFRFFDKKKVLILHPFINNENECNIDLPLFNPFLPLHHMLPLKYKFMPEAFVYSENNNVKAFISVIFSPNNRLEINRLFFNENDLTCATELIKYVVARYKKFGASSVTIRVDNYLSSLLATLVSDCGFSQISGEKLWKAVKPCNFEFNKDNFRNFRDTDAKCVADIYNKSLLPHIKPFLITDKTYFCETLFKGLSDKSEYKYIIKDFNSNKISGYLSIQTYDYKNYVLDIIPDDWFNIDISTVLGFAYEKISKRNKDFVLYLKTKQYTSFGEKLDDFFTKNSYECVQEKVLLTNSSAQILKANESSKSFKIIGDFFPSKPMPT